MAVLATRVTRLLAPVAAPRGAAFILQASDVAPTHDMLWRRATAKAKKEFWQAVVTIVLDEKDAELARGLDRFGRKLAPLAPSTILHRVSEMGRADPSAPPLMPAYEKSRTRAWLKGRVGGTTRTEYYAEFDWRRGWGDVLLYHAAGAGRLPVRDVIGLAPTTVLKVRRRAASWWRVNAPRLVGGVTRQGPPRQGKAVVVRKPPPPPPPPPPPVAPPVAPPRPPVAPVAPPPADLRTRIREVTAGLDRPSRKNEAITGLARELQSAQAVRAHVHGMSAPEEFRTLEFEGMTLHFPEVMPWDPANPHAVNPVVATLRALTDVPPLPSRLTATTRNIYFTRQANRYDAIWEVRYNMPGFESAASGGDGNVAVYKGRSLTAATFGHEAGHNLANRLYGTTTPSSRSDYTAALNSPEPPVSAYAKASPAEDFAEAVELYTYDADRLKEIAPLRYDVIRRIMGDPSYGG